MFDELKVVVNKCKLPMLLFLTHIQSETQKHVIGVFPGVRGDKTSHIVNGIYSKCITIPFISDTLDWCRGDGGEFSHAHEGFLLMPNKKRKIQQNVCAKETSTPHIFLDHLLKFYQL